MSFNPKVSAGIRRYPLPASPAQSLATNAVIAITPGTLYGLYAYSDTAQWIMLHDAIALPADATKCLMQQKCGAASWVFFDFGAGGLRFFTGLVVSRSTTTNALTIAAAAADCMFLANYSLKPV